MNLKHKILSRYTMVTSDLSGLLDKLEMEALSDKFTSQWISDSSSAMGDDDFHDRLGIVAEEDEEEKPKEEEVFEKAEEWIQDRWYDFENEFHSKAEEEKGKLVGYRCIGVDSIEKFVASLKKGKYMKGYKGVGIYFSWNEEAAECHWGKGSKYVTVKALIPLSSIDIKRMARANMDMGTYMEDEITLKQGAKILIDEIFSQGTEKLLEGIPPLPAVAEV